MTGARRKKIDRTIDVGNVRVHKTITISLALLQRLDDSVPLCDYIAMGLDATAQRDRAIAAETSARDYEDRYRLFSSVLQQIEAAHPDLKTEIHDAIVNYKIKQIEASARLDAMG